MRIFGIGVDPALMRRWREWLAPAAQPFYLSAEQAVACGVADVGPGPALSEELHYTFTAWRIPRGAQRVWLDENQFFALPRRARANLVRAQAGYHRGLVPTVRRWSGSIDAAELRAQADGHRFVWWPSMLERVDDATVGLIVERIERVLPSRHAEVTAAEWMAAGRLFPRAEELAGTFAPAGGPNCFGTVMAAAGVAGAAETWMVQEPFEVWLNEFARAGGDNRPAGTVLVWRDRQGTAQHAAVTLGGGWGLHKPSASWWSPRKVLAVRDIIRVSRSAGLRICRYSMN